MAQLPIAIKATAEQERLERQATEDLTAALQKWAAALLRNVNSFNLNTMLDRLNNPRWAGNIAMRDALIAIMQRAAEVGVDAGVEALYSGNATKAQPVIDAGGVDWELVNVDAAEWALNYSHLLMNDISSTTRRAIQREIAYYVENSMTISQLRDRIMSLSTFSETRANRIAVTETTRAYAEGNMRAWSDLDYVERVRWQTANDDLVCPICGPLNQQTVAKGELFAGRYYSPPAHVNCRCGLSPVVTGAEDAAAGVVPGLPGVTAGPSWKPSMSREEAEAWAAGSRHTDDVYHVTWEDSAQSIIEDGFKIVENPKFGRLLGDGVYVGPNERVADFYQGMIEEDSVARKLVAKIKIDNPIIYEWFDDFDEEDIIWKGLEQKGMDTKQILKELSPWREWHPEHTPADRARLFTEIVRKNGFDSIIFHSPDRFDMEQIVVFDTKKVVVIND